MVGKLQDDQTMKPFQQHRIELSVQDEYILWGSCVRIPPPSHAKIIDELHAGRPGISQMKSLARTYVWWPLMDRIHSKVKNCQLCQQNQKSSPAVQMQTWEWPAQPWSKIHISNSRRVLLIAVDAHSEVIVALHYCYYSEIETIYGLPRVVVSDNGSVFFISNEFQEFMIKWRTSHYDCTISLRLQWFGWKSSLAFISPLKKG